MIIFVMLATIPIGALFLWTLGAVAGAGEVRPERRSRRPTRLMEPSADKWRTWNWRYPSLENEKLDDALSNEASDT